MLSVTGQSSILWRFIWVLYNNPYTSILMVYSTVQAIGYVVAAILLTMSSRPSEDELERASMRSLSWPT
jgi:hypothetical protein